MNKYWATELVRKEKGDVDFWLSITPKKKMSIAWQLVVEKMLKRGVKPENIKIDRSICRLRKQKKIKN